MVEVFTDPPPPSLPREHPRPVRVRIAFYHNHLGPVQNRDALPRTSGLSIIMCKSRRTQEDPCCVCEVCVHEYILCPFFKLCAARAVCDQERNIEVKVLSDRCLPEMFLADLRSVWFSIDVNGALVSGEIA